MPTYKRRVMCAECPFRANAIKGWLGPSTPEQVNAATRSEEPYICHVSMNALVAKGEDSPEELEELGQHCVGMARYRSSICKSSRDPEAFAFQQAVKTVPDKPVIPANKFLEHHGGSHAPATIG